MPKNDPTFIDFELLKEYDEFVEANKKAFIDKYGYLYKKNGRLMQPIIQKFESNVVKKAKLLIYKYLKSKGKNIYNEIETRNPKSFGAPKVDLCDIENNYAIELVWKHKSINHKETIDQVLRYCRVYGKTYLLFLSWGEGNSFKTCFGFERLQDSTLKRYKEAGIDVIFFNVDKPNFDWLR